MSADRLHFVPAHRKAAILDLQVSHLFVVAHENLGSTNHWCFYLQTSPSSSIQLDCQPSHSIPSTMLRGGSMANLILLELPYVVPPEAKAQFLLDVEPSLAVREIHSLIINSGRHNYEFNESGTGCRKWVTNQLDFLSHAGLLLDRAQVVKAKDGILKLCGLIRPSIHSTMGPTPLEVDRGPRTAKPGRDLCGGEVVCAVEGPCTATIRKARRGVDRTIFERDGHVELMPWLECTALIPDFC
ncbi:hypothetical protein N7492_001271 [Penicillium capsulatum]|uniref:DUF7770 domain-containing protein n=1 Tax=Penicillium capsulatum TaxID=69766 RepID=A0A9W9LZQ8_9EURO|nr:hypothetical protein N7492_001271 [Penicillium capsulatum]KAJ6129671.1 hypothetical protein N7512_002451 [Penicillium capsulatum]